MDNLSSVDILLCSMAMTDHLLRFRAMTTGDLLVRRAALELRDNEFASQSMGTKNFARDLRYLQDQLNAIAFVLRERGDLSFPAPAVNYGQGITDFSGIS